MVGCGLGVAIVPASFATLPQGQAVFRRLDGSRFKSRLGILRGPQQEQDDWSARVVALAVSELESLRRRLAPRQK